MVHIPVESGPFGSSASERLQHARSGSLRSGRSEPAETSARRCRTAADPHRAEPAPRSRRFLAGLCAGLVLVAAVGETDALPLGDSVRHFDRARSSFITERRTTLAPMGHVVFCMRHAEECRNDGPDSGPVDLTPERLAVLKRVNAEVNRTIRPRPDRTGAGVIDQWSLAPEAGDCEDYALTKRHRLQAEGWPASALRLATARTRDGSGHAVLVVRTAAGDLVLDNRTGAILPWTATDLSWIAIQSGTDPRLWHEI